MCIGRWLLAAITCIATITDGAAAGSRDALVLEATIPLPDVAGRIDHLAIDLRNQRLFVVELGNRTIDVIDLNAKKVVHRISGLDEPQGIAYLPEKQMIVVACGGDGTVKFFNATDFSLRGVVALGGDADNIRIDPRDGTVVVGHGAGGLAVIDPTTLKKIGDFALPGHPEGFQISPLASRIFANVPEAREIAVVDTVAGQAAWHWKTQNLGGNFPMALDEAGHAVAVAFRSPARLVLFDSSSGERKSEMTTCGDADDVFFDSKRRRYYVSCGAGAIDVFQVSGTDLTKLSSVATAAGARTSLFLPERDQLFLAVPAGWFGAEAAVRVYRVSQ